MMGCRKIRFMGSLRLATVIYGLAAVDGLARFDGASFSIFNKSNSPGIINNRIISLFEAANGNLWAGTEESGIVRFQGGQLENFGVEEGIPRSVVWIESDANSDGTIFTLLIKPLVSRTGNLRRSSRWQVPPYRCEPPDDRALKFSPARIPGNNFPNV